MGEYENTDEQRWERQRQLTIKVLWGALAGFVLFSLIQIHPVMILVLVALSPMAWIAWRIYQGLPPRGAFDAGVSARHPRGEGFTAAWGGREGARNWAAARRSRRAAAEDRGEPWRSERWIQEKTEQGFVELSLYLAREARRSE